MSEPGEPDARDWFGGRSADPEAGASARPPSPADESDAAAPGLESAPEPEPAPGPGPELTPEPAPEPELDPRVRLRALTGGLADLSDAMAAIGVESVALRSDPTRPSTAPPTPTSAETTPTPDFRVRCPDCGPQYVAIADVRFVETGDGAEANRYLFTCPACGARVRRPAGPELAAILKSAGVATLALRRSPGQAL